MWMDDGYVVVNTLKRSVCGCCFSLMLMLSIQEPLKSQVDSGAGTVNVSCLYQPQQIWNKEPMKFSLVTAASLDPACQQQRLSLRVTYLVAYW